MTDSILLIGGGGHCNSCIDVIEQEGRFKIAGIVDLPEKQNQRVLGYPILGSDRDLPQLIAKYANVLITLGQLGSSSRREEMVIAALKMGANFPTVISPMAYVSPHARVGKGTIVMHQALINANAGVGENCIINTKALIEHDASIEAHCHVSTGALVNGGVILGKGSFWGSGAVSKEYTRIPPQSFIKANSLARREK